MEPSSDTDVSKTRSAVSLIETLVVVCILGVLVGLLLPAVQQVRAAAAKTQSANKLRQLALGLHQFASTHNGNWGALADGRSHPVKDLICPVSLAVTQIVQPYPNMISPFDAPLDVIRSPADPTFAMVPESDGLVYALPCSCRQPLRLDRPAKLQSSFLDGTSNTVALAERYFQAKAPPHPVQFSGALSGSAAYVPGFDPLTSRLFGYRPAVFADAGWLDVVPVTSGFPPVARPSVPGTLFQVRPTTDQADGHQLQTPYASGLLVALFDGSVRTIHPNVSEGVFWGAVTPAGGEIANLD